MRRQRFFRAPTLIRHAERRTDDAWIQQTQSHCETRFLPLYNGRIGIRFDGETSSLCWLADAPGQRPRIFLGKDDSGQALFAVSISDQVARDLEQSGVKFSGLRGAVNQLPAADASVGAYARALDAWHNDHRFCARCGAPTAVEEAGFRRSCGTCRKEHFPRLDPAVIMAIVHDKRVLLARQPRWPERVYSVLAGFVEPGESLEDAVVRESEEEAGIKVHNVRYHDSQPWPFPSSLMVGFRCDAVNDDLTLGEELSEAHWFTARGLKKAVMAGDVILSQSLSISRDLVDHFVFVQTGEDTAAWPKPDHDVWSRR